MRSLVRLIALLAVLGLMASPALAAKAPKAVAIAGGVADTSLVALGSGAHATHAFVAWPASRGNAPCIVVIHEWWGLNEQIRGVARWLAREGYVAIVPDLYHGQVAADPELAHELSRALEGEGPYTDLGAAIDWLHGQPEAAKSRIGVLGFCVGGGLSQRLALRRTDLSAAVMFYGAPETGAAALKQLGCPLLAHFGATDRGIPAGRSDELRKGLAEAGKVGEVYVYPGAGHAFMNETRPSYHPDAARQAWARTLAFLQRTLKS